MLLREEIANDLRRRILASEYRVGDELPARDVLCAEWQCAPGTAREATQILVSEGLVELRQGRRPVVRDVAQRAPAKSTVTISAPLADDCTYEISVSRPLSPLEHSYLLDLVRAAGPLLTRRSGQVAVPDE